MSSPRASGRSCPWAVHQRYRFRSGRKKINLFAGVAQQRHRGGLGGGRIAGGAVLHFAAKQAATRNRGRELAAFELWTPSMSNRPSMLPEIERDLSEAYAWRTWPRISPSLGETVSTGWVAADWPLDGTAIRAAIAANKAIDAASVDAIS